MNQTWAKNGSSGAPGVSARPSFCIRFRSHPASGHASSRRTSSLTAPQKAGPTTKADRRVAKNRFMARNLGSNCSWRSFWLLSHSPLKIVPARNGIFIPLRCAQYRIGQMNWMVNLKARNRWLVGGFNMLENTNQLGSLSQVGGKTWKTSKRPSSWGCGFQCHKLFMFCVMFFLL